MLYIVTTQIHKTLPAANTIDDISGRLTKLSAQFMGNSSISLYLPDCYLIDFIFTS